MNFKLLILFSLLALSACGVKGPPSPPEGTTIPSYMDKFLPPTPTATATATATQTSLR